MLVRGATLALVSWAGCCLAGGWLWGCAGGRSRACTTKVTPEVCETPAQLRTDGVAPVVWVPEAELELTAQPLVDGRYWLLQRALDCGGDFVPPPETLRLQSMLEIRGCVARITTIPEEGAEPQVSVSTFNYGADGGLELTDACSAGASEAVPTRHGFDGTTLQLPISVELSGADGKPHACSGFDTYQL
jgi:hypothetical protein